MRAPLEFFRSIWNEPLRKGEIVGIQYLRGFAAISVVLAHTSGMAQFNKYFGRVPFGNVLEFAGLGVDLFFVISGFIIVVVSLERGSLAPRWTISEFLRRRFVRIIPIMWVAIISYAAFRYAGRSSDVSPWAYIRALVLWPGGNVEPKHIWTLRQEWLFYLLFGLTFIRYRTPAVILIWYALPVLTFLLSLPNSDSNSFGSALAVLAHPTSLEFGLGTALGVAYLKRPDIFAIQSIKFGFPILLVLTALFIAIATILKLLDHTIVNVAILGPLCFLIVLLSLYVAPSRGAFARVGLILGDASYSIYLFHLGLVSAQLGLLSKLLRGLPVELAVVLVTTTTVGICLLLYHFIERPLLRWMNRVPAVSEGPKPPTLRAAPSRGAP